MSDEIETQRDRLEVEADVLRSQLARTLESLNRRRHVVEEIKEEVQHHPSVAVLVGAGSLLFVAGGATGLLAYRAHHRRHALGDGVRALARLPQQVAQLAQPKQPPIAPQIVRKVAIGLTAFVAIQLGQRVLRQLVPALKSEAPAHVSHN
jgi:hypothetical protein